MSSIPPKDNKHSWSVAIFETHRSPLTNFLKNRILPLLDSQECRRIVVRAPVKSGKREMVEYLAVRDQAHSPQRVHGFVSSFHRVADEEQRKELAIHNMRVFSLRNKKQAEECAAWATEQIAAGKQVAHVTRHARHAEQARLVVEQPLDLARPEPELVDHEQQHARVHGAGARVLRPLPRPPRAQRRDGAPRGRRRPRGPRPGGSS